MLNHFLAVMEQQLFLLVTLFPILSIYLIYSSNLTAYNKSFQCIALSLVLGTKLSFPSDTAYILSSQSYFAQQEENELYPICIITPSTSKDVSLAIWSLSVLHALSGCRFAIPGGGHTPFAGSANINNGVIINMQSMKGVKLNSDQSLVSVGAGETWGDIFMKLDDHSLSTTGGRVSRVGVRDLTLGGRGNQLHDSVRTLSWLFRQVVSLFSRDAEALYATTL